MANPREEGSVMLPLPRRGWGCVRGLPGTDSVWPRNAICCLNTCCGYFLWFQMLWTDHTAWAKQRRDPWHLWPPVCAWWSYSDCLGGSCAGSLLGYQFASQTFAGSTLTPQRGFFILNLCSGRKGRSQSEKKCFSLQWVFATSQM